MLHPRAVPDFSRLLLVIPRGSMPFRVSLRGVLNSPNCYLCIREALFSLEQHAPPSGLVCSRSLTFYSIPYLSSRDMEPSVICHVPPITHSVSGGVPYTLKRHTLSRGLPCSLDSSLFPSGASRSLGRPVPPPSNDMCPGSLLFSSAKLHALSCIMHHAPCTTLVGYQISSTPLCHPGGSMLSRATCIPP